MLRAQLVEADHRQYDVKTGEIHWRRRKQQREDGRSGEEDNTNQDFGGYEGTCPEDDEDPADSIHGRADGSASQADRGLL